MATDNNNNNPEKNAESPFQRDIHEAGHKLSEQAHHLMKEFKFETPAENPGGNSEIAGMLSHFSLFDGSQQNPGDSQAQGANGDSPMEQPLMNLLTGGKDATPTQEAAMGIGKEIMSGLMGALQGLGDDGSSDSGDGSSGADSSSGSDSTSGSDSSTDGSDGSDGSDDTDSSDSTDASQDDSSMQWPPAWMAKFASAELAGRGL